MLDPTLDDYEEDEFQSVRDRVEQEGFDYAFRFYSRFEEVEDEEFHRLRVAYVEAANTLADYIGLDD